MCGICGELAFGAIAERSALEAMAGALKSRGPDAEGYDLEGNIGLAHRRLVIAEAGKTARVVPIF